MPMHVSRPASTQIEVLDIKELNPQISECVIKVCYVSDEPNRNGSVITKEAAKKLAVGLRGCPIVGYYEEEKSDYKGHEEMFTIDEATGEVSFKPTTKPFGFVDLNAPIWFQTFIDDETDTREYLCTKGFLWTDAFPECRRILEKGNNQSMEIAEKKLQGEWTKIENHPFPIFIISEGLIEKLCILGEDVEPCFEGAQLKAHFSLNDDFKQSVYTLVSNMKNILSGKGGYDLEEIKKKAEDEASDVEAEDEKEKESETPTSEPEPEEPRGDNPTSDEEEEEETPTENALEEEVEVEEPAAEPCELEIKLTELTEQVAALIAEIENLKSAKASLEIENSSLKEFKLKVDRAEKQSLIDKFSLLSNEDKSDVVSNIDTYSLDEIESKLCVLGVRKGIFSLGGKEKQEDNKLTFSLGNSGGAPVNNVPQWVLAAKENENN